MKRFSPLPCVLAMIVSAAQASETHWEFTIDVGPPPRVVTVDSSAALDLHLDATAESANVFIAPGPGEVALTIGGLKPHMTYHVYTDGYQNHGSISVDGRGSYSLTLDTSRPRVLFIQAQPSTLFIVDDGVGGTGGDCSSVGTWNGAARQCTLTTDVYDTVQVVSPEITLDCDNHRIIGPGFGNGIFILFAGSTVAMSCDVSGFGNGAVGAFSNSHTFEGNHFHDNVTRGAVLFFSSFNAITDNLFSNNIGDGLLLSSSSANQVIDNAFSGNDRGLTAFNSSSNEILGNDFSDNTRQGLIVFSSNSNSVLENLFTGNGIDFNGRGSRPWNAISLVGADQHVLKDNILASNGGGLGVELGFDHDIDPTNILNGKKIYYLTGLSHATIDPLSRPDAATIYCIECSHVTIEDFVLDSTNQAGVLLAASTDSEVTRITSVNNQNLVTLVSSDGNTITYATALNGAGDANFIGIAGSGSSGNTITHNTIDGAGVGVAGIDLFFQSDGNRISHNSVIGVHFNGIRANGDNNVIEDNSIRDAGVGIATGTSDLTPTANASVILDNDIRDGRVKVFGDGTLGGGNDGIQVSGATNTVITGNRVINMVDNGLYLLSALSAQVFRNDFVGNAPTGFDPQGSPTFQVRSVDDSSMPVPIELSNGGVGNFWGRNCGLGNPQGSPLFQPGVDSNDADVKDSNPFRHPVSHIPATQALKSKPCPTR